MGSSDVDQVQSDGSVVLAPDRTLSESEKNALLIAALPGAKAEIFAGQRVVRWGGQVLLKKQVTHLGRPWSSFKKRIQIPRPWVTAYTQARAAGLVPRFIGIYHYRDVTVFVDFDPHTYVRRAANNSAAHLATNDLFQAQTAGVFTRRDRRGNLLTSVREDRLAAYLTNATGGGDPRFDVLGQFNDEFMTGKRLEALDTVKEMHGAQWSDAYQGEWPGFYLEFRVDEFLRRSGNTNLVEYHKNKVGSLDYDLVLRRNMAVDHYGDLKASNAARSEAPGNDARSLVDCVSQFGRFWYVIYEHETWHSRDSGNQATMAWNAWRYSIGHWPKGKPYDSLSYSRRFKEAVRFQRMMVLELNVANLGVALGDFHQGRQQGGAPRARKFKIRKRDIDNFLVYSWPSP